MGRREVVVYVCDWCNAEAKPTISYGTETPPEGWEDEIDYCLMCPECQKVRKEALSYARHRRLNGWPLVMDESRPQALPQDGAAQHKSVEPQDKHGTPNKST